MMKIGIFTFHRALNYGAFLQAFALKFYLESLGNQVKIVDYWPKAHAEMYSLLNYRLLKHSSLIFSLKYIIHVILKSTRFVMRRRKMERLWKLYFFLGKKITFTTSQSLSSLKSECLVYGSDQIWWKWNNQSEGLFDWAYWGDYVPPTTKKVSYAASMGVINVNETEKKQIAQRLENFQAISVREYQLQQLIQSLTAQSIYQVVDPVFLLGKEIWDKYAKKTEKKKYVLLFNLMNSPDANYVAKKKAEDLHCELIEITPSVQPLKFGRHVYQTLDAFEFIGFIKNAEFVVTSSFHCAAFSIIFEKQFYAVGLKNNSGRVVSLLKFLNIEKRFLNTSADMEYSNEINYVDVLKRLRERIFLSEQFLQKSLDYSDA